MSTSHRFNDEPRGSARDRGYSARWDREAKAFRRQHPLCVGCGAVGLVEVARVVDHIEPHRGDPVKMWDWANWQSACLWHHNDVKQALEAMFDRGQVDASALRLDSPEAIRLTKAGRTRAIGADGWPAG